MAKFIRVPPSGGKTTFVNKNYGGIYRDSDALLEAVGVEASYAGFKAFREDEKAKEAFLDLIPSGGVVLSNFDPFSLIDSNGEFEVQIFGYKPEEYVDHIKMSGRNDLLENFGEEQLSNWMVDLQHNAEQQNLPVTWMRPGTFISDYI